MRNFYILFWRGKEKATTIIKNCEDGIEAYDKWKANKLPSDKFIKTLGAPITNEHI